MIIKNKIRNNRNWGPSVFIIISFIYKRKLATVKYKNIKCRVKQERCHHCSKYKTKTMKRNKKIVLVYGMVS